MGFPHQPRVHPYPVSLMDKAAKGQARGILRNPHIRPRSTLNQREETKDQPAEPPRMSASACTVRSTSASQGANKMQGFNNPRPWVCSKAQANVQTYDEARSRPYPYPTLDCRVWRLLQLRAARRGLDLSAFAIPRFRRRVQHALQNFVALRSRFFLGEFVLIFGGV